MNTIYHIRIRFENKASGVFCYRMEHIEKDIWTIVATTFADTVEEHISHFEKMGIYSEVLEEALERYYAQ